MSNKCWRLANEFTTANIDIFVLFFNAASVPGLPWQANDMACHGNASWYRKHLQRMLDKCTGGCIIWPRAVFSSVVSVQINFKADAVCCRPSTCLTLPRNQITSIRISGRTLLPCSCSNFAQSKVAITDFLIRPLSTTLGLTQLTLSIHCAVRKTDSIRLIRSDRCMRHFRRVLNCELSHSLCSVGLKPLVGL